jgi:hypothetical protein
MTTPPVRLCAPIQDHQRGPLVMLTVEPQSLPPWQARAFAAEIVRAAEKAEKERAA